MQYSIYSDLEWTYPDSPFIPLRPVLLETARGGHAAFQLLGETLPSQTALCVPWNGKRRRPETVLPYLQENFSLWGWTRTLPPHS